jgi:fructose-1,6-bisphosphatase/inositol monophosphatase family enzyme
LTIDNARNRTLAFIGRSRLWDWAGAIPIIIKAGGTVRYVSGQEIQYRDVIRNEYRLPDYVLVYNSDDFEMVRNIFKKI